jgi:surface protein
MSFISLINIKNLFKLNGRAKSIKQRVDKDGLAKILRSCEVDADLNYLDVSGITDMVGMFNGSQFNGDISKWDVSKVRSMHGMFYNSVFNSDISKWNVSKLINMNHMFSGSNFNGDISEWDVSNAEVMHETFGTLYKDGVPLKSSAFNGDISRWKFHKTVSQSNNRLAKLIELGKQYEENRKLKTVIGPIDEKVRRTRASI